MNNDRFKFRVWDCLINEYRKEGTIQLSGNGQPFIIDGNMQPEDIDDVIIEQCTGLTDKNGRLIFEGDRCRVHDSKTGQPVKDTVYVVAFTESASGGCASFCFRVFHCGSPKPYGTRPIYANGLPNIEVVGTIHDQEYKDQFRDATKMVGTSMSQAEKEDK